MQCRADPGDQSRRGGVEPGSAGACGPVLRARGEPRRRERGARRRAGADPDCAGLGWWAARLGGRAAVRRPGAHHQRRAVAEVLRLQARHHLAQRGQRPSRRHRADGGARHPARFAVHPGHPAQPRRRPAPGGGDHRQRVLQRHGLRRVRALELPLRATLRGPARSAVLASAVARPATGRSRAVTRAAGDS